MSTETNANGAAPAVAPNAPAQPPVVPPPAAQPDHDKEPDRDPAWLGKRLERERKNATKEAEEKARAKALADLGVDDPERVKKLLAEDKKREEAQKSQEQKIAEFQLRDKERDSRLKELEEAVKLDATEQLASLTDEQRAAVLKLAGEDPAKQRNAIATLRPTWAKPAPEAKPQDSSQQSNGSNSQGSSVPNQAPNAAPVAPAKPATPTAPAPNAPPPAGSPVVENHLETYLALSTPGTPRYAPFVAAAYRIAHWGEINAAQKARGG